jgi:enamine deaminase RidA (YjgF/YER057c/UK114 family)
LLLAAVAVAGKKKDPDDITQTLALPKDPPAVGIGETRRLVFQVSPLSAKGLLSQQTRDGLKAILKANGGAPVVHIRAFVAGSGDLRRVPQIVSEVFTERKAQLPSVSVVQVGGLALEGAQVELEVASVAKKDLNPDGLGFVALGAPITGTPLAVTCYASDDLGRVNAEMAAKYPSAAITVVQPQRAGPKTATACEAVVRGGSVKAEQIAFTGTRVGFGPAAVDRLNRDLAEANAESANLIASHVYALAGSPKISLPTSSVVPVDGVASIDATFAVDAVASLRSAPSR